MKRPLHAVAPADCCFVHSYPSEFLLAPFLNQWCAFPTVFLTFVRRSCNVLPPGSARTPNDGGCIFSTCGLRPWVRDFCNTKSCNLSLCAVVVCALPPVLCPCPCVMWGQDTNQFHVHLLCPRVCALPK